MPVNTFGGMCEKLFWRWFIFIEGIFLCYWQKLYYLKHSAIILLLMEQRKWLITHSGALAINVAKAVSYTVDVYCYEWFQTTLNFKNSSKRIAFFDRVTLNIVNKYNCIDIVVRLVSLCTICTGIFCLFTFKNNLKPVEAINFVARLLYLSFRR